MGRSDALQVGAAGEHYVAFRLAQLGYVVAIPRGGSPTVDLLVSNVAGTRTAAIQVKTAAWAERERGRGAARKPHGIDFQLGHKFAQAQDGLFFAFVDLRGRSTSSQPVVWILPAAAIRKYCGDWYQHAKLVRWQVSLDEAARYKDAWQLIADALGKPGDKAADE